MSWMVTGGRACPVPRLKLDVSAERIAGRQLQDVYDSSSEPG
jgi:hypothetical protein